MSDSTSTIRVAILGGGLAGIAALKGLLKYPHIAVDIYEPRPAFREEGPAVELSDADLAALRMLDPSLDQYLARAGALRTSTEVRLATGPLSGQVVMTDSNFPAQHRTVVSLQELLAELAAGIPPRAVHFNARVASIREAGGGGAEGATLVFGDGSQKKYDIVIGADGVQGITRRHVLGGGSPSNHDHRVNTEPRPTGYWGLHVTVPLERAQAALGPEFLFGSQGGSGSGNGNGDPARWMGVRWVGDGTFMQHQLLNGGRDVQVVVYARLSEDAADGDESRWVKLFTPDEFGDMFAGCRPDVCKGIVKVRPVMSCHAMPCHAMPDLTTPVFSIRPRWEKNPHSHAHHSVPSISSPS